MGAGVKKTQASASGNLLDSEPRIAPAVRIHMWARINANLEKPQASTPAHAHSGVHVRELKLLAKDRT